MGFDRDAARDGPMVAGRYALYDQIAAGGMATVHLGRLLGPIGFARTVAIKRMLPQFVSLMARTAPGLGPRQLIFTAALLAFALVFTGRGQKR